LTQTKQKVQERITSNPGDLPRSPIISSALRLENLSVRFGEAIETVALDRVSLEIEPGNFVVVLGPSGCGKSTLLNVIAGFEPPTSGRVEVDGKKVSKPSPDRSVVFQQHSLFPWMTALENVSFGLRMLGKADATDRAKHYLGMVGLSEIGDRYPHQLSGGMQQRVGLARALVVEPKVLLMDEPFGALDAQTRVLMQEQLVKLWEEWRHTVVFVTHDIDEALFLADQVIVMGVKPNSIRCVFDIEIPRPRGRESRLNENYQQLYQELFGLIRQESLKSFKSLGSDL
jgi:NitT/TauT family transport system ATP-binding protein